MNGLDAPGTAQQQGGPSDYCHDSQRDERPELCMVAGMNDYIGKPVRIETLETTLNRWL